MNLRQTLTSLPNQPLNVRLRIIWITTALIGLLLVIVWFMNVKGVVQETQLPDVKSFADNASTTPATQVQRIKLERSERKDGKLLIYFAINNETTDILSFSTAKDITITLNDKILQASELKNRQNGLFVQKILSKTENFGIAVFEDIKVNNAPIKFDQLYFENNQSAIFHEEIEFDLEELNQPLELRS